MKFFRFQRHSSVKIILQIVGLLAGMLGMGIIEIVVAYFREAFCHDNHPIAGHLLSGLLLFQRPLPCLRRLSFVDAFFRIGNQMSVPPFRIDLFGSVLRTHGANED